MNSAINTFPSQDERASRSTGSRIATAPNNKDARTGIAGERSLPKSSRLEGRAHDTTEESRASNVVPETPAAAICHLTAKQLQKRMGWSLRTLRSRTKKIDHIKDGRLVLFPLAAVEKYERERTLIAS